MLPHQANVEVKYATVHSQGGSNTVAEQHLRPWSSPTVLAAAAMIYAIGGMSGSGKTLLRQWHQNLRGLPCIDRAAGLQPLLAAGFAAVSGSCGSHCGAESGGERHCSGGILQARRRPACRMSAGAKSTASSQQVELNPRLTWVVLLCTLCAITRRLEEVAARWNEPVTYIWCHAPWHECRRRVQANTTDSWQRKNARLDFIDSCWGIVISPPL